MKTFTIYHVPGHKVGATADYRRRERYNFRYYGVEPYIIDELELPDTPATWQIVGDLEFEYADEFGYERGKHYKAMRQHNRLTQAGRIAGGLVSSTWLKKLTDNQAKEIRDKYIPRKYTMQKLATEYNVSYKVIHQIVNNITYKHKKAR